MGQEFKGYTRVTDVLYPFSGLSKIDPMILRNAANRGTKIHEICDAIVSGIGFIDDHTITGYIESFQKWMPKNIIDKPARFFCSLHNITGECDGIYLDGQDMVLFDLKTPLRESKTWNLQGSAYSYLAKLAGYNIKRIEFIKLDKTGKEPKIYTYKEDFKKYLCCLEVYREFFEKEIGENPMDYL